ncbi:putative plasma membrane iron permease protein [Botryosphaeria dothidea]|uniref:Plasma membrane iron permease protein n=1 Tax=Botryosphaeria dothidea TaxID=55169 RepID=A0A8H4N223_9PEZI|nr:putative plasma membrane iron permease protein [Botryosphaeria dothidea]
MIGAFYAYGKDHFANTEDIWEGVLRHHRLHHHLDNGCCALRVNKLQDKWRVKLVQALDAKAAADTNATARVRFKRARGVVYIGGVSLGLPATAFPLAVICGLAAGCAVGYILYRGGNSTKLQIFLIISTCFLYLVAAGLFSRAVWYFENNTWNKVIGGDASETGSGAGSYDIRQSVWHVNCCNPELNGGGGWGIFNAILGWQNSATYGSVLSYNLYWLTVLVAFVWMRYSEKRGNGATHEEAESSSRDEPHGVVEDSAEKKDSSASSPPPL